MINYYLLTKPGIILGNLLTLAGGFFLASKGYVDLFLFFITLLGLALIIASACVFNNYIDRKLDKTMARTQNRPLVTGLISGKNAIIFGSILVLLGTLLLFLYTNLLTTFIALTGFSVYVFLYSLWKGRTIYGTAVGSVAGAVPPLVGYTAVSNQLDLGAFLFFMVLVLWQMPHFFSIAIFHFKDYKRAGIPAYPIVKGMFLAKLRMALYIVAFLVATSSLTFFDYVGVGFFWITLLLGISWLLLCLGGFFSKNDERWGRQMFYLSLVIISGICLTIPYYVK